MKISELIKRLQFLQTQHGDLEVFDSTFAQVSEFDVDVSEAEEGQFPSDWDMPNEFITIGRGD